MNQNLEPLSPPDRRSRAGTGAAGHGLLLLAILLLAAGLRFTGLNWDEGQWIHPDEGHMRYITMLVAWPDDLSLYFDAQRSPLNSFNQDHPYSYGTLPLFLVRRAAEWLDRACGESPAQPNAAVARLLVPGALPCHTGTFTFPLSAVIGRALSALADVGSVWLVYLIGRRLHSSAVGLLAAALAALTAFAVQQAHFFTVDSLAAFLTVLVAYFSVRAAQARADGPVPWGSLALAGLATGLATACKLSAVTGALFVALAGVAWGLAAARDPAAPPRPARLAWLALALLLAALLSLLAFRVAQPYAFEGPGFFGLKPYAPWWERMGQIRVEQSGDLDSPPGQQWTARAPLLFAWLNIVVWGMGLPLGLAAWAGWAALGVDWLRGRAGRAAAVLWLGTTLLFLYQATRWVKTMRYFLPLYPLLGVAAAYALLRLCSASSPRARRAGLVLTTVVLVGAALWALAVLGIYLRPHTRLAASRWIYDHVPPGTVVANEHWDWGVPLSIDGHNPFNGMYVGLEMSHYDQDTPEKRARLLGWLDRTEYIFLASNRLYGSIARLPARYPLTTAYYRALFAGDLGFELAADFTSYPALGPLLFPDQETPFPLMPAGYQAQRQPIAVPLPPAEEAWSVYDHPRVLIFHKTPGYSRRQAEALLSQVDLSAAQHSLLPKEATPPTLRLGDAWLAAGLVVLALAALVVRWLPRR